MPDPTPGNPTGGQDPTPTPGAPAGGNPNPTPGNPTGGNDIQKAIDAVVARERRDADARVAAERTQREQLEQRLKAREKGEDAEYIASVRKPLEDELTATKSKLEARDNVTKRTAIEAAAKGLAVEGAEKDVADALLGRLKITDDGKLEVVGADGKPEYGKSGQKTVAELVTDHLRSKPFLAKASARAGLGIGDVTANSNTAVSQKEQIKQQIAELESKGKFREAAPLKAKLATMK